MARQGDTLISALDAEVRAHRQLVNVGDELKTVQKVRQEPDEDEIFGLHKGCEALVQAGRAIEAAVNAEPMSRRKGTAA